MTKEVNSDALVAERGTVYTWINEDNPRATFKYCLVVSGESRSKDAIISVLFVYSGYGKGFDNVDFEMNGEIYHVHGEMITYTGRQYLGEKLMQMPESSMYKIEEIMRRAIGLEVEDSVYKELYDDLVGRIVKGE